MRIAYVSADPGVPVFGRKGCSVHVQEVIRAMLAQEAEITLFTTCTGGEPPRDLGQVEVCALAPMTSRDPVERERQALASNNALAVALRDCGPFDLIYERYSLWCYAAMEHARAEDIPGLLEVNAPLIEEQAAHRGLHDRRAAEQVACRAFGAASHLVAVSAEVARYLHTYPQTRGRISVVHNGVNPKRFDGPVEASEDHVFTIGFVGTLKPWHGLPDLVNAFAEFHAAHPASRLLIVGDGPERTRLERQLSQRGLFAAVHLSGAVDPEAIPDLLATMDIAVAPYPDLEHFYFSPLKVYEYMAAGRAVVASRIGQLEEIITDGRTGILTPPGDPSALARVFAELFQDPDRRTRLGQAARQEVVRAHTWGHTVARIFELARASAPKQAAHPQAM